MTMRKARRFVAQSSSTRSGIAVNDQEAGSEMALLFFYLKPSLCLLSIRQARERCSRRALFAEVLDRPVLGDMGWEREAAA